MIKYIIALITCLLFTEANAQYDGKGRDEISRFRPGAFWFYTGVRPGSEGKPRKYDRLIFDLTYNDWLGDRDLFKNHWASLGLNTNVMFDIPLSKGNTVAFAIGVSHQFTTIRHNAHLVSDQVEKTTTFYQKDPNDVFSRSSLTGNSFSMPIELRFRNASWKHFKFHVGGKIGYQATMNSKYRVHSNGHTKIIKSNEFYDVNRLIYSAHVRIGMRNWALFASYNFNTLFSNKQSTQLNLVQMGLSLSLY